MKAQSQAEEKFSFYFPWEEKIERPLRKQVWLHKELSDENLLCIYGVDEETVKENSM